MTISDKKALPWILIPLLLVTIWCGGALHHFTHRRAALKEDFSTVNNIKYGLLSVDLWRDRIQEIVSGSIGEFVLKPQQEKDLKKVISNVLTVLLSETDLLLKKRQKTLGAKIQKLVVSTFFDTSDLRKKIPALTDTIIREIKKPSNTAKLKHLAQTQLDDYSVKSYDNTLDPSPLNRTLTKNQASSPEEFNAKTKIILKALDTQSAIYRDVMLASLVLFLFVWWRMRKNADVQTLLFTFGVAFAMVFVITSVTIPMMEIDTRIDKVDIVLVSKHLEFKDQVLFFRSKSILQVVKTMINTHEVGTGLVGLLILLFSVIFPVLKLISAEIYLRGGEKIRAHQGIYFFAFKSGKWSMADVMVIAIFMAYIGFNGILNNQLTNLNIQTETLEAISTSGTSLQPGFILFVTFVLYGLLLSSVLERLSAPKERLEY